MDESPTTRSRPKVVVVGGGFGGVNVSRVLAKSDVDLTIIDRTNHHLFQPLLYQVATGILPEGLIAPALRRVVQKQKNTKVVLGQVVDLDLQARTVAALAPDGARIPLPYDTLVVAAGATHAYFGPDEWEEFAPGMKTLEDARHLRNHILGAFEMAELATDPADAKRICRLSWWGRDRQASRSSAREERIEARTKVWAAGVQASPLAKMLAEATGAETDRAGRIMVEPDCTLPGHPEVFAIGDMASLNGLPGIAQPALQEGKYVGKVIRARLDGDTSVAPFKYFDKGTMATIGRTHAVARSGGMSFTGITAYLMWAFIHVLYLIGSGNRFGTLYSWGRSLWFTKNRAHRIITLDQAIDEIGVHASAAADTTSSENGARQPSTTS